MASLSTSISTAAAVVIPPILKPTAPDMHFNPNILKAMNVPRFILGREALAKEKVPFKATYAKTEESDANLARVKANFTSCTGKERLKDKVVWPPKGNEKNNDFDCTWRAYSSHGSSFIRVPVVESNSQMVDWSKILLPKAMCDELMEDLKTISNLIDKFIKEKKEEIDEYRKALVLILQHKIEVLDALKPRPKSYEQDIKSLVAEVSQNIKEIEKLTSNYDAQCNLLNEQRADFPKKVVTLADYSKAIFKYVHKKDLDLQPSAAKRITIILEKDKKEAEAVHQPSFSFDSCEIRGGTIIVWNEDSNQWGVQCFKTLEPHLTAEIPLQDSYKTPHAWKALPSGANGKVSGMYAAIIFRDSSEIPNYDCEILKKGTSEQQTTIAGTDPRVALDKWDVNSTTLLHFLPIFDDIAKPPQERLNHILQMNDAVI